MCVMFKALIWEYIVCVIYFGILQKGAGREGG
jgi:hypothetical protein